MPKQNGIIKIAGTLDDITFYKSQDGHLVKKKTSLNGDRIKTDDTFVNTRANMAEFGRAGKAGKLFRKAFNLQLRKVQDNRIISRLLKRMSLVLQSDTTPNRGAGLRLVEDGNLQLLQSFNCNIHSDLGITIDTPYTASFDRPSGKTLIDMPAFTPKPSIKAPGGTTHFKIFSATAELDFAGNTYTTGETETDLIPWDTTLLPSVTLSSSVTAASTLPIFVVMGILFYKVVNGVPSSLNTGTTEAMSVVKVDTP